MLICFLLYTVDLLYGCAPSFLGRHTAENIHNTFDSIIYEFNLSDKVSYIVSDNASNMAKAFSVAFPSCDAEAEEQLLVDDESIWSSEEHPEDLLVGVSDAEHIRCFAHTLQLTVKDGLKHTKPLYGVMGKASKVCSLLHTSTNFQVNITFIDDPLYF